MMKKVFFLLTAIASCYFAKSQQTTNRSVTLDSSQAIRVAPALSNNGDFNVLLLTEKGIPANYKWIASQYKDFVDTSLDNTFKKIDDSTYEIDVKNPCKNIFLVNYGNIREDGRSVMLSDFSSSHQEIYSINYSVGNKIIRYNANDYNPFFFKYSQIIGTRDVGRKFIFKYKFPKPILVLTTINDSIINEKKKFPSINFINLIHKKDLYKRDSLFSQKNNSILFVFEHFGRLSRIGINDYLKYRLDNDSDWSFTALSYSPSILLENLHSGKHTLYVSYNVMKGEDAAVLEYHFAIAPN